LLERVVLKDTFRSKIETAFCGEAHFSSTSQFADTWILCAAAAPYLIYQSSHSHVRIMASNWRKGFDALAEEESNLF